MSINPGAFAFEPVMFNSGIPSNFYDGAPVTLRDPFTGDVTTFPTNEHYFQAMKVAVIGGCTLAWKKEMFVEIAAAANAGLAKRLGRQLPMSDDDRAVWDGGEALSTMLVANIAKFTQHDHCRAWLVGTGQRPLVEHRPDPLWGDNMDGSGRNLLGAVLELVRALVR
jgi:ribA/ribD-fused uncharacterized protein